MAVGTPTSQERQTAKGTYPADMLTVGDHQNGTITSPSQWLAKPAGATHIKLQALTQNLRYRIDTGEATAAIGFQLASGSDSLIPVPNTGISLAPETAGATYQAQWVR